MSVFQCLFIPLCLMLAAASLYRVQRRKASLVQGLLWAGIWACGAGLIAFPMASSAAARWLGVGRGTDLLFYLGAIVATWLTLHSFRRYHRLEAMITELVRREAIAHPRRGNSEQGSRPPCAED